MSIKRNIKALRPPLKKVAPLTFWICIGFALVNACIWLLLFTADPERAVASEVPIAPSYSMFIAWSFWFLFLSASMVISLARNRWNSIKRTLILGLVSKLIWTYALIFMIIDGYQIYSTLILWSFLSWVQAWTIVFFVPTIADDKHGVLPENGGEQK